MNPGSNLLKRRAHAALAVPVLATTLFVWLAAAPCSAAGNSLANPDFESGLAPWRCIFQGGAAGVEYRDSATHRSGDWSETIKVRIPTPGAPGNIALVQSGIDLAANQTVSVSFFAKSSITNAPILCVIGQRLSHVVFASQKARLQSSWRRYSFDFTPTRSVSGAQIQFEVASTAQQVWIDQVYLGAKPLFEDDFNSRSLDTRVWDPFITDPSANGWPWSNESGQPRDSSAIDRPNKFAATYDLPSMIDPSSDGLDLNAHQGTTASGYTWTGSVLCTCPDTRFAATTGFTFENACVEVCAKLPAASNGEWPAIWFLAGPGSHGGEIDLQEGGYPLGATDPDQVMACNLHTAANKQTFIDTGEGLSKRFHVFAMAYKPGQYVKMYLDGKLVASYSQNVPIGSYYIIIDDDLASAQTASWHSQISGATPVANHLSVAYVRVIPL